jgi:MinD superfamily P-loop ATPase
MHEILVISGKGGTGKTSLTAAFAHLSSDAVLCDLDVDAPDLHLVLRPAPAPATHFSSGFGAQITPEKCTACGICMQMCRFNAIRMNGDHPAVDPIRCEGCGVCYHFCPEQAVCFTEKVCGEWSISDTRFGPLVHAQLYPGEENSGKLVALLRREAKVLAQSRNAQVILSDGPPGIGCPVISALSGQQLAVLVTEPTPSGLHDLRRVAELCDHFRLPAVVVINKCDLHSAIAAEIGAFCQSQAMPVVAELPHDLDFVHAMVQARAITEYSNGNISKLLREAWKKILEKAKAN